MKLLAASALALSLTLAIGCAEGNSTTPETEAVIANAANKVQANVTGMDCSGCSYGIETALKEVDGVTAAKADHATGQVTVALADDADTSAAMLEVEKVIQELSDGKYTVNTINATYNPDTEAGITKEPAAQEPANEEPAAEEPAVEEQANAETTESYFTASYNVTGMDCTGCSSSIVRAVEQVDGVQKVQADHASGAVSVTIEDRFDDKVKMDEIKDLIAGLSNGKYTVSY